MAQQPAATFGLREARHQAESLAQQRPRAVKNNNNDLSQALGHLAALGMLAPRGTSLAMAARFVPQALTAPRSSHCSWRAWTSRCSERSPGLPCPAPGTSPRKARRHEHRFRRSPWARQEGAWPSVDARYRKQTPIRDARSHLDRTARYREGQRHPLPTIDTQRHSQTAGRGLEQTRKRSGRCFGRTWPGRRRACSGAPQNQAPERVARSPRGPTCEEQPGDHVGYGSTDGKAMAPRTGLVESGSRLLAWRLPINAAPCMAGSTAARADPPDPPNRHAAP